MARSKETYCPACGPVPFEETSRYCAQHTAELKATYERITGRKLSPKNTHPLVAALKSASPIPA